MQSGHQPLNPGRYTVNNFQGEHANPIPMSWSNTVYKHETSTAIVETNSSGGVDIKFTLCPTQSGRPFLGSIYSEYNLTIHGVKVNSACSQNSLTLDMISIANAKHDIKGLSNCIDTIEGALTSEEIGNNSISVDITHKGSSNYEFNMVVKPNNINIKCQGATGTAISLLQTIGLFKDTTITARLQFVDNDNTKQSTLTFG